MIAVAGLFAFVAGEVEQAELQLPGVRAAARSGRGAARLCCSAGAWRTMRGPAGAAVDDDGEAAGERPEQFEHRDVEREAGDGEPRAVAIAFEPLVHRGREEFITLRCVTITPLGLPVEPDV